ncbi:hypothetical protein H6784_02350 [Candidatus Nomurabacteria bacterium]|nr:hypothetical protein [Candidatus Nomurabacteria bacterium]
MTATSSFASLTITNQSGMGSSSQSVILTDPVTTTGTLTMLASTSLQLPASATSTFQDISLEGTSGSYVWLRSSTPGTQANFYVPGTQQTVNYVNVKDNNGCPADLYNPFGYDAGNNTCWNFIEILVNATTTNHTLGQVDNEFSFQNKTDTALFAFNLEAESTITITDLVFTLSGVQKLDTSDLINLRLYKDNNSDRLLDGGDTQIDASGILTINGQHGAITFSSDFSATSSADYLLIGDTVSINGNAAVVISLPSIGITADVSTAMTNTVDYIQHIRNQHGAGSKSDRIGGAPPDGDGDVFGGGDDGGGEVGQPVDGENIAADVNFFRPTATGDIDNEWTNPSNAFLSDGVYATAATINLKQSYDTFGFNIPGSNTIEGIAVKLDISGTTASGTVDVSLSWDGGSSYTTAKATPALIGTDVVYTVGGASDKWGRSWTPANFSNALFRLRVTAQPGGNTLNLDALEVRIFHQAGGGGAGGGGGI